MSSDNKPFFIRPSKLNVEKIQNNFGNYTSTSTTTNSILNNKPSNDDSTITTTTAEGSKGQDVVNNCTSSTNIQQQQPDEIKSNHVSNSGTTTSAAATTNSSILTKSSLKDGGESNNFVFGSNLSERVTEDSVVLKNSEEKEPDTSTTNELSRKRKNSEGNPSLEKDVDDGLTHHEIVFEEKKPKKVQEIPGIDYTTGEENEKNVLQLSCKLFAFQNSNWVEKCTGMLRLNDIIQPSTTPLSTSSSSFEESSNKINSSIVEAPNRIDLIRPSKFNFNPSQTTTISTGSIKHKPDVNTTSDSGDKDNTNNENQSDDKVPDKELAAEEQQDDMQGEEIENKQVNELIAANSDNNVESLLSHKACSPTVVINSPPRHTSSSTEEMTTMTLRSRLIVRARGSLRLLFNSFIFPSMVLERAGEKSIRFTADSSTEIGIYLLMLSSSSDADKLYSALEHRKRELK